MEKLKSGVEKLMRIERIFAVTRQARKITVGFGDGKLTLIEFEGSRQVEDGFASSDTHACPWLAATASRVSGF